MMGRGRCKSNNHAIMTTTPPHPPPICTKSNRAIKNNQCPQ